MKTYVKQALFILAVVAVTKYVNGKLPENPLDAFLPS
jgi:hypothetical protein